MDEILKAKRQQGGASRAITIRGAREHNLKNVDVEIPRDRLVVFTGLSGSGKSSLAFDTIYAEGQRRYVESLSAYARQFLEMMQKPAVDQIDGLSPALSIEQALKLAEGLAVVELTDTAVTGAKANKARNETAERLVFSEKFACPVSGFTIPEIEPRLFSFNNPFGACPKCGGLGVQQRIDPELVVDKDRALRGGAILPWEKSTSPYDTQTPSALAKSQK